MSQILDDIFSVQCGPDAASVAPYSDLLDQVVSSCPDATVVRESRQWSKQAAIGQGNCEIFTPAELQGDTLPFDPEAVAVQITYTWDAEEERYDLAWVATWPYED